MSVYLLADIRITDDAWVPAYAARAHDFVHRHGGRYLARSGRVTTIEGKPLDTTLIAIMEFPSSDAARGFLEDPEYAPLAAARRRGSDSRFQLIDNSDLAGTLDYLPRG